MIPLTGTGCLKEFVDWRTTLQQFCYDWDISNSLLQARVAKWRFQDRASKWWQAHRVYTPPRLYSYLQLVEWAGIELAPRSNLEASQLEWSSLKYRGKLAPYFQKVQELRLQFQTSPLATHLMASRPFGEELQEDVRAAHARAGPGGLLDEAWEAIITAYVKKSERNPDFIRWGTPKCEPEYRDHRHTRTHLRTIQVAPEDPPLADQGQTPDEEKAAQLYVATIGLKKDLEQARFGKGPWPCFCCGQEGHSWMACSRKVAGKCGVCST